MENLRKIKSDYENLTYENNYYIGGGLAGNSFSSNRHENAKNDCGKLTIGKTAQLFKKATKLSLKIVKDIIEIAVPNPEWHHAGLLPKSYGGGMKKTYYINAKEIVDLCENWNDYELQLQNRNKELTTITNQHKLQLNFLSKYANSLIRVPSINIKFFVVINREMNGKYGWFNSAQKSYNLKEYYSGWQFRSQKKYNEYINKFL